MRQMEINTVSSLVSIIIPTYNRALDLHRALKSVMNQTYPHWECLIIDNHSIDNTDATVHSFCDSRIKLFKVHNHGVIAISRNEGIRQAKGKYIAFLDSDDWWLPLKLKASVDYLEQGLDLVYHDLYRVSKPNQRLLLRKVNTRDVTAPVFDDLICNGNALSNSSVVVRRELLSRIKGLTENPCFVGIEDYQGWLEISKLTEKFKRIPNTLGYYWAGGGNTSNPERTINNLSAFETYYADDIYRLVKNADLSWLHYSKGRAFYRVGAYSKAKHMLDRLSLKNSPFFIVIKLIWMKSLLYLMSYNPK